MKLVYICSPLKGDIQGNIEKAKGYCREALLQGYIPIAPHIYFTQFLDDTKKEERLLGMKCGLELLPLCDELWIYGNNISKGMEAEINYWETKIIKPIRYIIVTED